MDQKRVQVFLSDEEWEMVSEVMRSKGFRTYSDVIRFLLRQECERYETS